MSNPYNPIKTSNPYNPITGLGSMGILGSGSVSPQNFKPTAPVTPTATPIPSTYTPNPLNTFGMPDLNGPAANTVGGVIYNTVAGLSPAAIGVAKNIGQQIARTVGSVGATAGNVPTQIANAIPGVPKSPLPFDQSIPTTDNPVTSALFGGQPVNTIQKRISDIQTTLTPYIGATASKNLSFPIVAASTALDLSGFGGSSEVKALDSGEIPEAFFKYIAKEQDPNSIATTLKTIGADSKTVDALTPSLTSSNTINEAKTAWYNYFKDTSPEETMAQKKAYLPVLQDYVDAHPLNDITKTGDKSLFNKKEGGMIELGDATSPKVSRAIEDRMAEAGYTDPAKFKADYEALQDTKKQITTLRKEIKTAKTTAPVDNTAPVVNRTTPPVEQENVPLPQDTTDYTPRNVAPIKPIEFPISGTTEQERVGSAIANSEFAKNSIENKGQEAYTAGKGSGFLNSGLSPHDMKLGEEYQSGTPITELAKRADNPAKFTNFMTKLTDTYKYGIAADTGAGGTTIERENYLPQYWDRSDPSAAEALDKIAKENEKRNATQTGLKPYKGFHNQSRVFDTYKKGEATTYTNAKGEVKHFKRANPNILEDLKQYYQTAGETIGNQVLKKGLAEAAPEKVFLKGNEFNGDGTPIVNGQGLNGISYDAKGSIANLLKGYNNIKGKDFIQMAHDVAAKSGGGTKVFLKSLPATGKAAGISDGLLSIYDHSSKVLKRIIYNLGLFHSQNITLSYLGATIKHPILSTKGAAESIPAFISENYAQGVVDRAKKDMIPGKNMSVYDAALRSGQHINRGLPLTGGQKLNPLEVTTRAMFGRQLPVLRIYLNKMVFGSGEIDPSSPEGQQLGQTIDKIMGEMNTHTMNMDPNTMRALGRAMGTPNFTISKWSLLKDAATKTGPKGHRIFGNPAANLARTTVIGKRIWEATVGLLIGILATGSYPTLKNALGRYFISPNAPSDLRNDKGRPEDIAFPKDYLTEGATAISNPANYFLQRENPLMRNILEALPVSPISGRNYYGAAIQNPKSRESWLSQYLKGSVASDLPIGVQNVLEQAQGGQGTAQTLLNLSGFTTPLRKTPTAGSASSGTSHPYNSI